RTPPLLLLCLTRGRSAGPGTAPAHTAPILCVRARVCVCVCVCVCISVCAWCGEQTQRLLKGAGPAGLPLACRLQATRALIRQAEQSECTVTGANSVHYQREVKGR